MALRFTTSYIEDSLSLFRHYKTLAEGRDKIRSPTSGLFRGAGSGDELDCRDYQAHGGQHAVALDGFFSRPTARSRDRDRDSEFEDPPQTREALMWLWSDGWDRSIRGARAALRRRPRPRGHDPRGGPLGDAGGEPPDRSLGVSLRPDRVSCQALATRRMEVT